MARTRKSRTRNITAHARRRLKRKNGGLWRAQFCTEVARQKRFELLPPRFVIATVDQAETDRYWNAIVGNGGAQSECGWCKDKWGLSWQIKQLR